MIGTYDLYELLKEYGIDGKKVVKNNANILDKGLYDGIKKTLDYLVNELNIIAPYIEKCPSVMYMNVNAVRHNYEFLKQTNITISNVESCLHVLSSEPIELVKTYKYVLENYGLSYINKITSILSAPVDKIKEIEKLNLSKEVIISAAISRATAEEIKKIIEVCRKNNIKISGSVFIKSASEIEEIIEICRKNKIEISGSVFKRNASEIEEIIEVCRKNKIEISGSVFKRSAEEIEKNIEYIKNNYGEQYLKPLIINKNIEHINGVFTYLDELNVLPHVINSASILDLTIDEIKERKEFIDNLGENIITNKGKFNSLFGMSKKNYAKKIQELNINNQKK